MRTLEMANFALLFLASLNRMDDDYYSKLTTDLLLTSRFIFLRSGLLDTFVNMDPGIYKAFIFGGDPGLDGIG